MKTAMIIHSLTGNTLSVAERLKESFLAKGMETDLIKIEPLGGEDRNETDPERSDFKLMKIWTTMIM